ncbi:MAG: hypothetical protein VCD50_06610 [Alphaproteobacteria bacterium]
MRDGFIGWQCRIRQHAFRTQGGRPSPGMRPRVLDADGGEISPGVTVLLIEEEPADTIAQFRYLARKTHDPAARHESAVTLLSSAHYQTTRNFSDRLTALFSIDSTVAAGLLAAGACLLEFDQFSQHYSLPCAVSALDQDDPAFQASYWHISLFNPSLPGKVQILAFTPDWTRAAD